MNVFYEYESIFGKAETAHLNRTLKEFFDLAVSIRCKLGKQGYLLDNYLSSMLAAANSIGIQDAADAGFDSASELRKLCGDVINGKSGGCEHPLYEDAKNYIESHPVNFQEEESMLNYYCVHLIGEFTPTPQNGSCVTKKKLLVKHLISSFYGTCIGKSAQSLTEKNRWSG